MPLLVFVPSRDTLLSVYQAIQNHVHLSPSKKKNYTFFSKNDLNKREEKKKEIPVHGLNTSSPKVEKIASCKPIHIPPPFIRRKRTNDGGGKQGRTKDREERGKEKEGEREGEES